MVYLFSLVDTATHDVTYQSVMKLVTNQGKPGSLDDLPPIPSSFIYGQAAERTKKETKQIQFKQLSSPQQRFVYIAIGQIHLREFFLLFCQEV